MKEKYKEVIKTDILDMIDYFREEIVCLDLEDCDKVKETINNLFNFINCVSSQLYETLAIKNIEILKKYKS